MQTIKQQNEKPKTENQKNFCKVCNKGSHAIRKCFRFQKMSVNERISTIAALRYCFNCFSFSHEIDQCTSNGRCTCGQKHHTLLHPFTNPEGNSVTSSTTTAINPELSSSHAPPRSSACNSHFPNVVPSTSDGRFTRQTTGTFISSSLLNRTDESDCVIFPTALVKVCNSSGQFVFFKAVIDACSDVSYITRSAVKQLNLHLQKSEIETVGVGNVVTAECNETASFELQSRIDSSFSRKMRAYVIDTISSNRPVLNFKTKYCPSSNVELADPLYNVNSKIDLLLGGDIDSAIKKHGLIKSQFDNICYQETSLGWVVSGSVPQTMCFITTKSKGSHEQDSLDKSIRRFWEVENMPAESPLTEGDRLCELIFENTVYRMPSGKYCVSLPFKNKVNGFSDMRKIALNRFGYLEKKLSKDLRLREQYVDCIREYSRLGHMREVDPSDYPQSYYIPHHAVLKEASSTTKLRVVFDASAKDSSLQSLNENLLVGPRLQLDLLDLLIQFRFYKIAFTADIEKMYRQIQINPNDEKFQLIVWRESKDEPIKTYALQTVTFGTTSAPYLAVKTLKRLAEDEQESYPLGHQCIVNGFYVDDCIYGADSIEEARQIQNETLSILRSAGFHLRKWSANHKDLLDAVPEADRESKSLLEFDKQFSVKTLGIQWFPSSDDFNFSIKLVEHKTHTKRTILSDIARIFDPLGWVSPCVILVKLLIQKLWSENKCWDDPLTPEINSYWEQLRKEISELAIIKVPRWLSTNKDSKVEVHGFADASQKGYAAAVYLKCINENTVSVSLIFSKTKVAPLKTISLPRLELMASVMLANMVNHFKGIVKHSDYSYHYWSDSQIALAWIHDDPHKRAVFVSHRVSEIQQISDSSQWRYVCTSENPADLGTRGISPSQLKESNLWWHGPEFLKTFIAGSYINQSDDKVVLPPEDNLKLKSVKPNTVLQTFLSNRKPDIIEISSNILKFSFEKLNKFSTLNKLIRVVAYCLRFKKCNRSGHVHINPSEYEKSLKVIVQMVQNEVYSEEISSLEAGEGIHKQSHLYQLHPFLNADDGLLRVSGRLENASHLNYDQKFPIILPRNHVVSRLIVRHAHLSSLHGTQQETHMLISQRYYIAKSKSLVKLIVNHCITCFRQRCSSQQQQMGLLPAPRVTPNRPFLNCGVDFAGPIELKKFKGRCNSHYKSYFAIFICFSTKAIHLEVVIDLSTPAFIAAFRRFIARRGFVKNLYSDCGSNFVGAKRIITRSLSEVETKWNEEIAQELSEFHTEWHYNPPVAPHFGGLWEAGVKSVKHHLKRVVGETRFTYDEFETLLVQIESILNSRPLGQTPGNPDVVILTPAHFLIQDSLISMPDNNLTDKKLSLLERWVMIQKLVQSFWNIWSHEYLNTLRQRKKWNHNANDNIKVNDIVLIKENNIPPNSWLKAIVVKVHPGSDGLVRVVTVKTKSSTFQRPIVKICALPIIS